MAAYVVVLQINLLPSRQLLAPLFPVVISRKLAYKVREFN